jgi:hypothetical protein
MPHHSHNIKNPFRFILDFVDQPVASHTFIIPVIIVFFGYRFGLLPFSFNWHVSILSPTSTTTEPHREAQIRLLLGLQLAFETDGTCSALPEEGDDGMEVIELPIKHLHAAVWNANKMELTALLRLGTSTYLQR